MEKEFTRSRVREVSERIQSSLDELSEELGIELTLNGGNFTSATFKLNLEGRMRDTDGKLMATAATHALADSAAKSVGLVVEGSLIGSFWKIKGTVYTVLDYKTKRPKYPLSLKTSDGEVRKSAVGFLKQGKQLLPPTMEDFYKWLVIDPDEDSVRESDVEIVDRVQEYFETVYSDNEKFLDAASEFTERGISKKNSDKIFKTYIKDGLNATTDLMVEILKSKR